MKQDNNNRPYQQVPLSIPSPRGGMGRGLLLLLCLFLLSSCGIYKKYERPDSVKAEAIYGDAQSGDSLGLGDLSWKEIFTDPTLQQLVEKVLAQNTSMRNADLQIQQLEYALKCTKLAYIPSIYFQPQGVISKMWDPSNRPMYSSMTAGNSKTYQLPLAMSWQLGSIGQLRNQKQKAKVNLEQMKNAKQAIQSQLVATTASLYYTLAMLDQQEQLMVQTRENWGRYLEIQRQLMDAGQANIAAVASIEATYYSICDQFTSIEDNKRQVENALSTLLGETSQRIDRKALTTFQTPRLLTTGAPLSLLSRRPDVRSAELALAAAFYDKNVAKSAFYPSLTLTASGQYTNSLGSAIVNPGMIIGSAIAAIAQPIFANGRLMAQYKISKLQFEAASNDFQQAVIAAGNEVNTAMVELNSAEESREYIEKQVAALTTALNATKLLMDNSGMNYLNVITAQNSLLQAQMSQISNRMEAITATINLYQALGGGTK